MQVAGGWCGEESEYGGPWRDTAVGRIIEYRVRWRGARGEDGEARKDEINALAFDDWRTPSRMVAQSPRVNYAMLSLYETRQAPRSFSLWCGQGGLRRSVLASRSQMEEPTVRVLVGNPHHSPPREELSRWHDIEDLAAREEPQMVDLLGGKFRRDSKVADAEAVQAGNRRCALEIPECRALKLEDWRRGEARRGGGERRGRPR
ncbi:hypothetical protein FA95DRAFT_1562000 [Auriscalpium vulgare]|uniref:Uncharacterized protein n=1 Tax=Auriscalpium vulgare TaxID=40419 RepID=A0ACB8RKL2_9AGAM|nr:hypothetical protein FA95DRAFT_1562000 [Auriscalpium vulgare]